MGERMKIRRTDDPNVCYMEADSVTLWTSGIAEFKVDTRDRKFVITPVMRGGDEGLSVDATEMHEKYLREQL